MIEELEAAAAMRRMAVVGDLPDLELMPREVIFKEFIDWWKGDVKLVREVWQRAAQGAVIIVGDEREAPFIRSILVGLTPQIGTNPR